MDIDAQIIEECITECIEASDSATADVINLENDINNQELIDQIFRMAHSIKGTAGFLGYNNLVALTHGGETLLNSIREEQIKANKKIVDALLVFFDKIRQILLYIEEHKKEPEDNLTDMIENLISLGKPNETSVDNQEKITSEKNALNDERTTSQESTPLNENILTETEEKNEINEEKKVEEELARQDEKKSTKNIPSKEPTEKSDTTIRVDINLLNRMMNIVGELVLSRNQVLQIVDQHRLDVLSSACQGLNLVTNELQDCMMKARLQPIIGIWNKVPRLVRDYCATTGKEIHVEMIGKDTELDRSLIESIKDPLTHIVRNSIDHGIEMPEDREKKGKSRQGQFTLKAFHESEHVTIEISDDGKGINPDAMKNKALELGLLDAETAESMSDKEAINLIFHPGLSTAEKVTNISGRGVGMDVVKTNIHKIKGQIDVKSVVDEGTTFKLKIPLTLAILPGLSVFVNDMRFIIPQSSLDEMIMHDEESATPIFDYVHNTPVYRLRDEWLPVIELAEVLKLRPPRDLSKPNQVINLIVIQSNEGRYCLLVDEIEESQDIVVKPLVFNLRNLSLYAGLNIMSDGSVAIVLDIPGLVRYVGLTDHLDNMIDRGLREGSQVEANNEDINVLLVESGREEVFAIPINEIKRIERITENQVSQAGHQLILKKEERLIPVWHLNEVINSSNSRQKIDTEFNNMYVLVCYGENKQSLGYLVNSIEDIEVIDNNRLESGGRYGVRAKCMFKDQLTEIIDMPLLVNDCLEKIDAGVQL